MSEPVTGHRGNRGEPAWSRLEWAANYGQAVTLTSEQCRDILLWANEVREDKNIVVRDNHILAVQLAAIRSRSTPAAGEGR